jgi:CubicO group peptidase (beta-lactamase class C family)
LMRGSAGVYSSARDLLTLAAAHLRGKETKFGGALADTLRVRMPRPMDAPAVAWFVDTINGQQLTYQVGMVGGFAGYLGMDVERRTAVVVLQNSFNWTDRIGHRLLIRMAHASPSSGPVALR